MSYRSVAGLVRGLEDAISKRVPLKEVVGMVGLVGSKPMLEKAKVKDLRDFIFVAARIHKMCDKFKRDRDRIEKAAGSVVHAVGDKWGKDSKTIAQYTWSVATIGIEPHQYPSGLESLFNENTNNKEVCNLLWSLSKWNSPAAEKIFTTLAENLIDSKRALQLPDDDIVALLRAMATIHEYRK